MFENRDGHYVLCLSLALKLDLKWCVSERANDKPGEADLFTFASDHIIMLLNFGINDNGGACTASSEMHVLMLLIRIVW